MIKQIHIFIWLLCGLALPAQITDNPPGNSIRETYTSGSYTRCAYNVNLSETHLSSNVNYLVKAGESIRIQASSRATPYSNIGNFSGGSFHAFVDPNYNLTGCGVSGTIVWDNFYTGDGSISREVRPLSYQLYPRNSSNKGTVVFSGTDLGNNSTITFVTGKTNFSNVTSTYNLTTVNIVNKRFSFSIQIDAELSEYAFAYYLNNDVFHAVTVADHVVCGDAYIISGQSNASTTGMSLAECTSLINSYGQGTTYGKYSRTYGSIWSKATGEWGTPKLYDPVNRDMKNHVGAWGLPLQYKIQEAYGIPTCIINGAVGSTSIEHHLPLPDYPNDFFYNPTNDSLYPEDIGGIRAQPGCFERVNTRVYNAGLENNIKGIFWWQGDAGCKLSYNYKDHFTPLYNLWTTYYPNFSRFYMIQIPSWSESAIAPLGMEMRLTSEYQRQFGSIFPKTTVMAANGIKYHRTESGDEIHHQAAGYVNMANLLFPLLEKDVYGKTTNINDLTPPDIVAATIYNNTVSLKFNQDLYVNSSLGDNLSDILSVIKFNNELTSSPATVSKSNPVISGKYLSFDVSSSTGITSVSYAGYIPNTTPATIDNVGCYLRNSKNVGALSFHNVPVTAGGPYQRHAYGEGSEATAPPSADEKLRVFPNPFKNELHISLKGRPVDHLKIADLTGRLVYEKENTSRQTHFDVSTIGSGVYILAIETDNTKEVLKLIKLND